MILKEKYKQGEHTPTLCFMLKTMRTNNERKNRLKTHRPNSTFGFLPTQQANPKKPKELYLFLHTIN